MNIEVAVYKGEDVLCMGTIRECAKKLGIQERTIYYYLMPAYQRKVERRKRESSGINIRSVVRI